MKIVLIGGTGLIGTKLGARLRDAGHEAVPAAPSTGVDTLTGEGLAGVLTGAESARRWLANRGDSRRVTADPDARYFGTELQTSSLVAGPGARRGRVQLAEWLTTPAALR